LGRDEHVCRHRAARLGDDGGDGARRRGGAHHDGRRTARGDSLDVRLQWLVHNLRVFTVNLDNFAQELVSKMETEFLSEE